MKAMIKTFILSVFTTLMFSAALHAQDMDAPSVKSLLESKNFAFRAQTVLPMGQASRQLTSEYDVRFWSDSIISHLPYFGRAYSASYGDGGGIQFTSTDFEYKVKARKKGGWDITIKPKDADDVREMNLTVTESGSASLQVSSNKRQPISFNGFITERK
jgi:hypothetical protein